MTNQALQKFYTEIPRTYETVNHILTCGLDMWWRRRAANLAAADGGDTWVDLCSGTGEMAADLRRLSTAGTTIVAADFSLPMLSKIREKRDGHHILFTLADASMLPFPDNSIDLVTISFALRNINVDRETLERTLGECRRVLKPGGRLVTLETSQPPLRPIRWIVHLYVRLLVKPIGSTISGSRSPYAFLSRTIRQFYPADEFARIIGRAGFEDVSFKRFTFGVAAVHRAVKK